MVLDPSPPPLQTCFWGAYMRTDLHIYMKKDYMYMERGNYMHAKKPMYIKKETCINKKRRIDMKRDNFSRTSVLPRCLLINWWTFSKETYTYEERDQSIGKETYIYEKRQLIADKRASDLLADKVVDFFKSQLTAEDVL